MGRKKKLVEVEVREIWDKDLYGITWKDGFGREHTIQDPATWSRSREQAIALAHNLKRRGGITVHVFLKSQSGEESVLWLK